MDYAKFKDVLNRELPLNRKERFYTATVLPSLLFHKGLSNFFLFLGQSWKRQSRYPAPGADVTYLSAATR